MPASHLAAPRALRRPRPDEWKAAMPGLMSASEDHFGTLPLHAASDAADVLGIRPDTVRDHFHEAIRRAERDLRAIGRTVDLESLAHVDTLAEARAVVSSEIGWIPLAVLVRVLRRVPGWSVGHLLPTKPLNPACPACHAGGGQLEMTWAPVVA